jgi:hypothetical protein
MATKQSRQNFLRVVAGLATEPLRSVLGKCETGPELDWISAQSETPTPTDNISLVAGEHTVAVLL